MEEAELLVSVCGIICGFHIQNDQIPVAWVKGNIQIHQRLAGRIMSLAVTAFSNLHKVGWEATGSHPSGSLLL